eukprot:TRINITY_DN69302_c0_g1_i1.p2 TRINITY_DN69302_c0_g1~~TRINITY_DN69302_c0_g1_i1.p2  ORF type:complete len:107 (+),score=2.84 TRINITY_DN69302_c0_g1_i1:529-849(+)
MLRSPPMKRRRFLAFILPYTNPPMKAEHAKPAGKETTKRVDIEMENPRLSDAYAGHQAVSSVSGVMTHMQRHMSQKCHVRHRSLSACKTPTEDKIGATVFFLRAGV